MLKITCTANKDGTGFFFPSEYNRQTFFQWLKKYKKFAITPDNGESENSRGYLEGAIIPTYCKWQYGIDPRARGKNEQRRFLFKQDFNYEIVNDRKGNPVRSPVSSKGMATKINNTFTEWAEQNGCPIPNPSLFKLWRDKYSGDMRFEEFSDFLSFLELECDAMPSTQTLEKLNVKEPEQEYPKENLKLEDIDFSPK
jgi:hypothetical protein